MRSGMAEAVVSIRTPSSKVAERTASSRRRSGKVRQPNGAQSAEASFSVEATRPPKRVVRALRTSTHPSDYREALGRAHKELTGREAPAAMLDVLTAHVSHETASGDKMYNYNFGGIKGTSPDGLTARYKTHEFFRGKKTRIVDGFRAYRTLDDGARDYLTFLQGRYGEAYAKAEAGDVNGFSHALKKRGYYTAPVDTYARAVRHHLQNPGAYAGSAPGGPFLPASAMAVQAGPGGQYLYGAELAIEGMESNGDSMGLPTTVQVARVMDAMSGLATRIGAPVPDDLENEERTHG